MRMTKTIVTMTASLAVMVACAGDSAPFLLDTFDGTRVAQEVESITYSTGWDDGTAVSVAVDGVTLKETSAPASGDVVWNAANAGAGSHTLTHTTYKNGVVVKVETAEFIVGENGDALASDTHNKVQLWENGPYWATTNIGAQNPEDYGCYFWWGDTVGYRYRRENNAWGASDGSSSAFSFSYGPTYGKSITTLKSEGWITADGVLASEHDAAHVQWDGSWRMPTKQELVDLDSNCDWILATKNGVRGYVVRGRGDYATASIFLPCAGYGRGTSLYDDGSFGSYWSSVPSSDDGSGYYNSWYLCFDSSYHDTEYGIYRNNGRSVRPVQGFTETPDPVTSDPVTPDPVTPDPVMPDPVTPDPTTPGYEVIEATDIVAPYEAPKVVTVQGVVYDGGKVVGIVELKLGKVNAKKKTSKVSGSVTTLDGKKHKITAFNITEIDGTTPKAVSLEVKDFGAMAVTIGGEQFAGAMGKYHVQSAVVGGNATGTGTKVYVDVGGASGGRALPQGTLEELLPDGEPVVASGGKWKFAKAASVKWAKPKKGAALPEKYDAESGKGLVVDTSSGKSNLSAMKLTYTPKKGTFKGSFKVYALEGEGKATKLKKYTVKVSGVVVGGVGYGTATCKKPAVSWAVTVK